MVGNRGRNVRKRGDVTQRREHARVIDDWRIQSKEKGLLKVLPGKRTKITAVEKRGNG